MVVSRRGAPVRAPRVSFEHPPRPARIIVGDCVAEMAKLPADCVDLVFADPPYNLQLQGDLKRPDDSKVDAVDDDWDKFASFAAYDEFTRAWLIACRRVMKPAAHAVGDRLLSQHLPRRHDPAGPRLLDPQRRGVAQDPTRCRISAAAASPTRTRRMIWAAREPGAKGYTFNYEALKAGNEDIQVRSDWTLAAVHRRGAAQGPRRQEAASDAEAGGAARARDPVELAARRSRARSVLRHRHHRRGRQAPRPPLHRHRARSGLCQGRREAHRRGRSRWRRRRSRRS